MRNRLFIFCLITLTVLAASELFVVLTTVSPDNASKEVLWVFFASFAICLSSLTMAVWHPIRQLAYRHVRVSPFISYRQAVLFSVVITLGLFFRSLQILSMWDIFPLAISAMLIEFFFQADKTTYRHEAA